MARVDEIMNNKKYVNGYVAKYLKLKRQKRKWAYQCQTRQVGTYVGVHVH